jgi:hypothetical protein
MFPIRLPLPFTSDEEPSSLHLEPTRKERMTPAQFLQTLRADDDNIRSSSFVAPRLGDDHFGYFEVEYEKPVYK